MRILAQPEELPREANGVCLALGVFDGVHIGHQAVVAGMIAEARASGAVPVVVTFDRHPNAVVAPHRTPALIQTLSQRLRALAALEPAAAWVICFDEAFSRLTGAEFVQRLVQGFGRIRSVFVGEGFHFGHRRSGHVGLLREVGAQAGFAVRALAPVSFEGTAVSSTRIREAIRAGDLRGAAHLLGRAYRLAGPVIRGISWGDNGVSRPPTSTRMASCCRRPACTSAVPGVARGIGTA
ncbi:MAG: bifunctional riboflavin kinase/FMN adenylyltransferase [Verrucomicrobia bacterium]|nr:bifunctional riboflavin kinase/FMN adenylyltransferase [Verrucomicrobiota bacterium]